MTRRRKPRRGVLLLIVLSLLVLFVLIGTTFIVVADKYAATSFAFAKQEIKFDPPEQLLDAAVMDLLRSSRDPQSPFFHDGLLADVYGNDGFEGRVILNPTRVGQMVTVPFIMTRTPIYGFDLQQLNSNSPEIPQNYQYAFAEKFDAYSGSLLTFTNGPLQGKSFRIVRFNPPKSILPGEDASANLTFVVDQQINPTLLRFADFVVNGKPFNGTGDGYNPDSGKIDLEAIEFKKDLENVGVTFDEEFNQALLPFHRFRLVPNGPAYPAAYPSNYHRSIGGTDESWDAPDYQNLFLATQPVPASFTGPRIADNLDRIGIPSLHRPFLINYWLHRLKDSPADLLDYWGATKESPIALAGHFRRSLVLRPLPIDHPNFNGSNPAFTHPGFLNGKLRRHPLYNRDGDHIPDSMDPDIFTTGDYTQAKPDGEIDDEDENGVADMALVSGPWDVDNDNDTIPDSVWTDLGYPIQTTVDGRMYKPLFAILCVDMDGRLNVNAHGMIEHQQASPWGMPPQTQEYMASPLPNNQRILGQGYGPAEVKVNSVLQGISSGPNAKAQILISDRSQGHIQKSLINLKPNQTWYPGSEATNLSGERVNLMQEIDFPLNYAQSSLIANDHSMLSNFSSAPDLKGRRFSYIDKLGQLVVEDAYNDGIRWQNEVVNDPYELNLVSPSHNDSIFTVAELELILRSFDEDASTLPRRLRNRLALNNDLYGRMFTTHSFDIPAVNATFTTPAQKELLENFYDNSGNEVQIEFVGRDSDGTVDSQPDRPIYTTATISELFAKRLRFNKPGSINNNDVHTWIREQLDIMLAPEIRRGEKLNLNRHLGNGVDNSNNDEDGSGVIDDALESYIEKITGPYGSQHNNQFAIDYETQFGDFDGDGTHDENYSPAAMFLPATNSTVKYSPSKQVMARHLYCLMHLLIDQGWIAPSALLEDGSSKEIETNWNNTTYKSYLIAQWAINVVDFKDPDAIMTPFEFDINPFDGWNVDGNIELPSGGNHEPQRGVVWGAERPELVMTESLALHNRRVRDMATDSSGEDDHTRVHDEDGEDGPMMPQEKDENMDQFRIPQGSLFVEMFCPRAPSNVIGGVNHYAGAEKYPEELYIYDSNTNKFKLNLGALAPINANSDQLANNEARYPVWRLAIVKHEVIEQGEGNDQFKLLRSVSDYARRNRQLVNFGAPVSDGLKLSKLRMNMNPTAVDDEFEIERIVWFGSNLPNTPKQLHSNTFAKQQIYWNAANAGTNQSINAGGYAIVGSRQETEISPHINNDGTLGTQLIRMDVQNNVFYVGTNANSNDPYIARKNVTPIIAGRPAPWIQNNDPLNDNHDWVGMSISEPIPEYPNTQQEANVADQWDPAEYYPEPTTPDGKYEPARDVPLDIPLNNVFRNGLAEAGVFVGSEFPLPGEPDDANFEAPGLGVGIGNGTVRNFKTILLQRLADPTRKHDPYRPELNPYVTVDMMPVDLSIYNGELTLSEASGDPIWETPEMIEGLEQDEDGNWEKFDGHVFPLAAGNNNQNNNEQPVYDLTFSSREREGTEKDPHNLFAMNYVDRRSVAPPQPADYPDDKYSLAVVQGLGLLNFSFGEVEAVAKLNNAQQQKLSDGTDAQPEYVVAPVRPFASIAWNNRPYANHLELLQVPASSASRLFFEFTTQAEIEGTNQQQGEVRKPYEVEEDEEFAYQQFKGFFGHLPNFLQSSNDENETANMVRILDFVEVPSRFVGTRTFHNPKFMNHDTLASNNALHLLDFSAPFNSVSNFRDPGKINVNTVANPQIWRGVSVNTTLWNNIEESRRGGNGGTSRDISDLPSLVSNPFRSSSALMPDGLEFDDLHQTEVDPIQGTLLRSHSTGPNNEKMLFQRGLEQPGPNDGIGQDARNTHRNSHFHYQRLQRMGNTLTTHSNVYAVWITVGYFEVLPWNPENPFDPTLPAVQDTAHPDGYQLGKELGIDTGETKRHRAFYMIDRSIPVGFQRGENLNTKDAIIHKRFIE